MGMRGFSFQTGGLRLSVLLRFDVGGVGMMAVVVVDLAAVLLASGSVKDVNFSVEGSLSFKESSDIGGGGVIRFSRFLISTVVVVVVGATVST